MQITTTDVVRARVSVYILTAFFVAAVPWTVAIAGAQSLPAGWKRADVGKPPSPGTATFSSPRFTVTSRGFDVNGRADQFTLAYKSMKGDVTIVARVQTLPGVDPLAQAGVMIRNGTTPGSRHAFVFATPGNGVAMRSRRDSDGLTAQTAGGAGTAPVWLKLERRSSTLTASRSSDGSTWTVIDNVTLSLGSAAVVGLAVASRSPTASVSAIFDNVSINGQSFGVSNAPPAVSLTTPASGTSFTGPASVSMSAAASDSDGTVTKVDFFQGSTLVGTDTTSPYALTWNGVAAGTYTLTAVATDNAGASTTSAAATITVTAGENVAPTVSLTSPAQGASFVAPASVTLSANASDRDGTIQHVRFYIGDTLVGTDTTSPYSVTWPAVLGSHSISAVATDNQGTVTVSAWRDFTVTEAPLLSTAIFKPATPGDMVAYYLFEVFAAGADPDTATPITTVNLGLPAIVSGECSADVRSAILALPAGNYVATVSAFGEGGPFRSNSFSFAR